MAYTTPGEGSGLDSNFDTGALVTKGELYAILAQLKETQKFYELEIFEVVSVDEINVGEVTGRYVVSEQGDAITDIENRIFLPLNSNIVQFPLRGELWLGMAYNANHYYLSKLSEDIKDVNFQAFNESTKIENITDDVSRGGNFVDIKPSYADVKIGDTLLQGRFDNYIILGSDNDNEGEIIIDNNSSFITMTNGDIPTTIFNSDRIEIRANTDELDLLAQKDLKLASIEGDVLVQGNKKLTLEVKDSQMDFITINGQKRDIANPDGDIMLPKFIKERAGDLRPLVEIFKLELQALPYLILPPVLPGGIPNPSFMIGMKIKYDAIKFYIETIKRFINLEWLPRFDFEMVNIQEVVEELGLPGLPGLDALGGFDGVVSDIAGAKAKLEVMKGVADGIAQSSQQVGGQLNSIEESGEVEPSDFITTLDEFESNTDNPPIDTTDVRDIISDGADSKELQRYFLNGGSPKLQELVRNAAQGQQDVAQLEQVINLAEISQLAKQE